MSSKLRIAALEVLSDPKSTKLGKLGILRGDGCLTVEDIPFLNKFLQVESDSEVRYECIRLLENLEAQDAEIKTAAEQQKQLAAQREADEKAAEERRKQNEKLRAEVEALRKEFPSLELLKASLEAQENWTPAQKDLLAEYERQREKELTDAETERLLAERMPQPPKQLSAAEQRAKQIAQERAEEARRKLQADLLDGKRKQDFNPYVGVQPVHSDRPRFDAWGNRITSDDVLLEW